MAELKDPLRWLALSFPSLPEKPCDARVVDMGPGPSLDGFFLDEGTTLVSSDQGPAGYLQRTLGKVRGRIVKDPEGERVQEYTDIYFTMIDPTTPPDILLYESRIWRGCMKSGNPALEGIALKMHYRIAQLENFTVSTEEAMECVKILRARIGKGDLDTSKIALTVYEDFLSRFFRQRSRLNAWEASAFRTMAQMKINGLLGDDVAHAVDEDMISHLEELLEVYAQIIFYNGIDAREIDDGTKWVETYLQGGHPLEHTARETLDSLNMVKDLLERKLVPPKPVAPVQQLVPIQDPARGNHQDPASGATDVTVDQAKSNSESAQEAEPQHSPKVELDASYIEDLEALNNKQKQK